MCVQECGVQESVPGILSARDRTEADWTKCLPGQTEHSRSFVLCCLGVLGAFLTPTCKGSCATAVLTYTADGGKSSISHGSAFPGVVKCLKLRPLLWCSHCSRWAMALLQHKQGLSFNLIWVLSLEFRVAVNFIEANISLSQTATRAASTSSHTFLLYSHLPSAFCWLTLVKIF